MGGAEVIIFWLVPVGLLVVFTIILLGHTRDPKRRKLLFLEPLGTVITQWRPVRFVGDQVALPQSLKLLVATRTSDASALDLILSLELDGRPMSAELLEHQLLGAWAEQRVVVDEGRSLSLLAGDPAIVLRASRYRSDGRTLLTESDRAEINLTAKRAGEHGYLALAVAKRYFHSRIFEADKHTWLGLILLEPIIDESLIARVRQLIPGRVKLLSVLPTELLGYIQTKVRGESQFAGIPTRPSTDPVAREDHWQRTDVLGETSFEDRFAIVRYFESRRDCRLVSVLPGDRKLPIRVTGTL